MGDKVAVGRGGDVDVGAGVIVDVAVGVYVDLGVAVAGDNCDTCRTISPCFRHALSNQPAPRRVAIRYKNRLRLIFPIGSSELTIIPHCTNEL